jgi:single-strand DNA-binding protein
MAEFKGIEAAMIGTLAADPETKTYGSESKPMATFRIGVGEKDATQWVGVAVFTEDAHEKVRGLQKGARVYVEGRIKLEQWTGKDGTAKAGLKVSAWKVTPVGQIGEKKPQAKGDAEAKKNSQAPLAGKSFSDVLSDEIPFAPETR